MRRDRSRRRAAYVAAAIGAVGLLSALSRPLRGRLAAVLDVVPVVVPTTAVLTLVFVSFALLLTALGLRRGHRLAWVVAELLLFASVMLHVTKGLDVEEAAMAAAAVIWLGLRRRAFPVLPSQAAAARAVVVGVCGTVAVVVVSLVLAQMARGVGEVDDFVGLVLRDLGGAGRVPPPFTGRFAAVVLAAMGLALLGSVAWLLFSPRVPEPLVGEDHRRERERARSVVLRYGGGTLDYFALRDDKQWFFTGSSVVAHSVRGSICLVSPDPIGPAEEARETWADFTAHAERSGWSVAVLGAAEDWLGIYEASGLRPVYLGDEAVVDCITFKLEGHAMQSVRRAHRRVRAAGYTIAFHGTADLDPATRAELLGLAGQSRRGEGERGFSMTLSRLFDPADTGVVVAVARDAAGRAQAFSQWVPATKLPGWSLDVMRRSMAPDLPNGIMDFLIVETIWWVRQAGGTALGLNFAVGRRIVAGDNGVTATARLARQLLRRASNNMQIESLWRFNAKYGPRWVPRFAAVGTLDLLAGQGLAMADAEGLTELPLVGRMVGRAPR
ncbi:bifunctional lysylphosphatidylglycerol flippase/synthetase MprF [Georgenia yuyongxinii]|uniref:bifunctional lysylphosphatidylglycerol flippase/synthetase MprF n=1 Tax=Georgenia yuyongxinii TaxID=2589797 RepID=UPI00143D96FB|nr:phosphatidylglycerol lysyltransferase domain-containing protein [Georgenia yuyongxinii]